MVSSFCVINGFPTYSSYISIGDDDYKVGRNGNLSGTSGISTCLAITLYNPQKKIGILAHIQGNVNSPQSLQPHNVIDTLVKELTSSPSTDCPVLEATLEGENRLHTPTRASDVIRARLSFLGITLIGEDLVPINAGRLVFLDTATGNVEVYRA